MCLPLRLLVTSGEMRTPYNWLNKLYSFSRCGLSTDGCHANQPKKSKPALYKLLFNI